MGTKIGKYSTSTDIDDLYNYSNKKIEIYKGKYNKQKGIIIKLNNITIQNKNDKKEFDANVKSTINILKDNDNFIQLIDYSFLQNDLVSFYYFNERKKYQSFYSFLKKKNLYHLKCSEIKNIIIQLNEIIKIFYSNKLPFPFFDIYQFYYDNKNKKIKFLYTTFFENYSSNYNFYQVFLDNIPNQNIKDLIQKKNYINYNIGNFIFNILFRESPKYNILVDIMGNKEYKLIIPDYKVIDYDQYLFELLHFLLDLKEKNKDSKNINFLNEEEKSLNLYFFHNYFKNILTNGLINNYQPKSYYIKQLNDDEIPNEGKAMKNIYTNYKRNEFEILYNYFSIIIFDNIVQVYNSKGENIYNIEDIKENNYTRLHFFDLKNDYIILYNSITGLLHFILIKEKYYSYFSYKIPINLENKNIQISPNDVKNKKKKKKKEKQNKIVNGIHMLEIETSISEDEDINNKIIEYKIDVMLYTSDNKLLIQRIIKPKCIFNDIIFVLDLNNLYKKNINPKIQLLSIIETKYQRNNSILENIKNKEIIMNDNYNIHFYDLKTLKKTFSINFENMNEIYSIRKISDEIFVIRNEYLIYILRNHNIIGTYYPSDNLDILSLVALKKNYLLIVIQKRLYEKEEEKSIEDIGFTIFDDYNDYTDSNPICVLLEIKEDNNIVKHNIKNINIEIENRLYFNKFDDNLFFRNIRNNSYRNPKNRIYFYSLEEN